MNAELSFFWIGQNIVEYLEEITEIIMGIVFFRINSLSIIPYEGGGGVIKNAESLRAALYPNKAWSILCSSSEGGIGSWNSIPWFINQKKDIEIK